MKGHAFGQPAGDIELFVKGLREKGEQDIMTQADLVYIVGPVNQQPAPDHDGEDREVDPVHPADVEGMFEDYFLHITGLGRKLQIKQDFR
jgi:hypothetical protein